MQLYELLITKSKEAELAQFRGDFQEVHRIIKQVGELVVAQILRESKNTPRLPN